MERHLSLQTYGPDRANDPTRWDYFTDGELLALAQALGHWEPRDEQEGRMARFLGSQVTEELLLR